MRRKLWHDLIRDRLGIVSDAELAREVCLTPAVVCIYRRSLGIPRADGVCGPKSAQPQELIDQLGKVRDIDLAKQFCLSPERIRQLRAKHGIGKCSLPARHNCDLSWREAIRDRLGIEPDSDLAREVGRSLSAVCRYRLSLGISKASREAIDSPLHSVTDWNRSNRAIADEAGVHFTTVLQYRKRHNIAPYRGWRRLPRKRKSKTNADAS